jgi:hypothetical protein
VVHATAAFSQSDPSLVRTVRKREAAMEDRSFASPGSITLTDSDAIPVDDCHNLRFFQHCDSPGSVL